MTDTTDWDNGISEENPDEESLIELTEIVEAETVPDEDDVIDLTEVVESEQADAVQEKSVEETEASFEPEMEDDFADLDLDIETHDTSESLADGPEDEDDEAPSGIELDGEIDFEPEPLNTPVVEAAMDNGAGSFPEEEKSLESDLDLSLEGPVPVNLEAGERQDVIVTPEQIEAALEKIIEKKFADKIEAILFEVMEKVMEKELAAIKDSLQKDLDEIENT